MSVHSYAGRDPQSLELISSGSGHGQFVMPAGRVGWYTCQLSSEYATESGMQQICKLITDVTNLTGQCEILPGQTVYGGTGPSSGSGFVQYDQFATTLVGFTESASFAAEVSIPGGGTVYDDTQSYTIAAGDIYTQGNHYTILVPVGMSTLLVQTSSGAAADADLFLMVPGGWNNDASAYGINSTPYASEGPNLNESITVTDPVPGIWDIVFAQYNVPSSAAYDLHIHYDDTTITYLEPPVAGPFVLAVPANTISLRVAISDPSNPTYDPATNRLTILGYPPGCWNGSPESSTPYIATALGNMIGSTSLPTPIAGDWTFVIQANRMAVAETVTVIGSVIYE